MLSCLKLKWVNRLISYVPASVSKFPSSDMTSRSWWSTRTTHGRTQSLPRSCVPTPRGDPARQSPGLMAWPAKPPPTFREPAPSPLPYRTSSSCVCGVHIPWLPLSSRCSAVQGGRMRVQDDTFTKVRIRTWIKWRPFRIWKLWRDTWKYLGSNVSKVTWRHIHSFGQLLYNLKNLSK